MRIYGIIVFLLLPVSSFAFNLKVGIENFTSNAGSYQIDTAGGTELFSFRPGVKLKTTLRNKLDISTSFFLPETSVDTLYTVTYVKADLKYKIIRTSIFSVFLGAGFYSNIISGSGKDLTLPNGGGSSTFFGPKNTVYNNFFVPEGTISIPWTQKLESDFSFMVKDLLESEKRSWSYLISLNWRVM